MKIIVALVFLIAFTALEVLAQSGDGPSVSFTGTCRLPDEIFTNELNDYSSNAYMSLRDSFSDDLTTEIRAQLSSESISFDTVNVNITGFTNGSVIVTFILIVDGSSMTVLELAEAAKTVSADSTIGNYTVDEIQDLDECQETSTSCSEFAECVNSVGSFSCECAADYFDQSGDGTICVTPVAVLCEASRMEISVTKAYLDSLSISLVDLRLNDELCGGTLNSTSGEYEFEISDDLSNCGSITTSNDTHVTYGNTLSNELRSDSVIITGTNVSIPFRCSYPKNLTTTISFAGEVASIDVSTVGGEGSFEVDLKLYTTESFTVEETRTEFTTADNLFLQAGLNSNDNALTVVLDRCWATPTSDINDATQYDIITSGCEVTSAVSGSVSVLKNGEDKLSRFRVQVFKFINQTTTYLHCALLVCSTANGNVCQPTCPSAGGRRRKRDILDFSTVTLTRKRRETTTEEERTVGPFFRVEEETVDVRFWTVSMTLTFLIVVQLIIIAILVMKLRAGGGAAAVLGLKMRKYEIDNEAYE